MLTIDTTEGWWEQRESNSHCSMQVFYRHLPRPLGYSQGGESGIRTLKRSVQATYDPIFINPPSEQFKDMLRSQHKKGSQLCTVDSRLSNDFQPEELPVRVVPVVEVPIGTFGPQALCSHEVSVNECARGCFCFTRAGCDSKHGCKKKHNRKEKCCQVVSHQQLPHLWMIQGP